MKRIFISLLLSIPVFVSCLIDDADVNHIDSGDLRKYTKDKIAETVALPVEALEIALALDDYLKMTDEERAADTVFACNVKKKYEDIYTINLRSDREFRDISCEIHTGGLSIRDKDARWIISEFSIYGNDFTYSNLDYFFMLPDNSELLAVAPEQGYWSVEYPGFRNLMMMQSYQNDLYSWNVIVAHSEDTDIGVKSYYGTSGEFIVQETLLQSGEKSNLYSGKFFVEIYRNDEVEIDYCDAIFDGTPYSVYVTSRDSGR